MKYSFSLLAAAARFFQRRIRPAIMNETYSYRNKAVHCDIQQPATGKRPVSRRLLRACLAPVLAATLSAAALSAQAEPVQIQHAQGSTTLAAKPEKIIVLDFATLDILDTLGVPVAGVPSAVVLPEPLQKYAAADVLKAGTAFEPNYEAINAAKPDLVLVAGRSAPKYDMLKRIAPTIDLTADSADLLGSLEHNTRLLAGLFDKEEVAEAKLQALHASIDELKAKGAQAGPGLIILTTGGKMSAYGPGSRFGVLHDAFGIAPADANLKTSLHGQAVSFEYILKTNPEWLFVIDRDAAIGREGTSAQRLLDNELVHKTDAWKKGQVVYLDAANWYMLGSAGLTAMQHNVDQLNAAFDAKQ